MYQKSASSPDHIFPVKDKQIYILPGKFESTKNYLEKLHGENVD